MQDTTQRPTDHVRPLPPTVIGRGKNEMTDVEIDALYPHGGAR